LRPSHAKRKISGFSAFSLHENLKEDFQSGMKFLRFYGLEMSKLAGWKILIIEIPEV
jgi:hypothetical protein